VAGASGSWEQLFWSIFHNSSNPIALFDEERVCVEVNAAICDLLGRSREEIVGRRLDEFMTAEDREAVAAEWQQLWELGEWSRERDYVRPDGKRVRVQGAAQTGEVDGRRLGVGVLLKVPVEDVFGRSAALGALTARERDVVRLVALGRTSPQIAEELMISTATVRTHVRNAMAKTASHTRAQLVAAALADRRIAPDA
jgi:PAS domain S-box-containing protein